MYTLKKHTILASIPTFTIHYLRLLLLPLFLVNGVQFEKACIHLRNKQKTKNLRKDGIINMSRAQEKEKI